MYFFIILLIAIKVRDKVVNHIKSECSKTSVKEVHDEALLMREVDLLRIVQEIKTERFRVGFFFIQD